MHLKTIQDLVRLEYIKNGFEDRWNAINDKVMADVAEIGLVAEEVGEAMHAIRHPEDPNTSIEEECADIAIRLMNFCNRKGIGLEEEILKKNKINLQRPLLHGDAYKEA